MTEEKTTTMEINPVIPEEKLMELNADFDALEKIEAERQKLLSKIGNRLTRKTQQAVLSTMRITTDEYEVLSREDQLKHELRYNLVATAWDPWKTRRWKPGRILDPWGNLYTRDTSVYWRPINHGLSDDKSDDVYMLTEPLLISTKGEIWSLNLGDYKYPYFHNGTSYITLGTTNPFSMDGSRKVILISMKKLMALIFPELIPKGEECNQLVYKNGNIWDNRAENIAWVKRKHKTYTRKSEVTA